MVFLNNQILIEVFFFFFCQFFLLLWDVVASKDFPKLNFTSIFQQSISYYHQYVVLSRIFKTLTVFSKKRTLVFRSLLTFLLNTKYFIIHQEHKMKTLKIKTYNSVVFKIVTDLLKVKKNKIGRQSGG